MGFKNFTVPFFIFLLTGGFTHCVVPSDVIIVNDLRHFTPLFLGDDSDYYLSTKPATVEDAAKVCSSIGENFHLVTFETEAEYRRLLPYLRSLEMPKLWTSGEKMVAGNQTDFIWKSPIPSSKINYTNFPSMETLGKLKRLQKLAIYREMDVPKCRNGFLQQKCEPPKCNVSLPECTVTQPTCVEGPQKPCWVERPECTATCNNCTIVAPVCTITQESNCTVERKPCTVTPGDCSLTDPKCTVNRPSCYLDYPPCVTPPTSKPCTTTPKPCCTTTTTTTKRPCPPGVKCEPVLVTQTKCRSDCIPDICQPDPIICPEPIVICPPEEVKCEAATIICKNPEVKCEPTTATCTKPIVECTEGEVICEAPVINCPGTFVNCPTPSLTCCDPIIDCPKPTLTCEKPEPCPTLPPGPVTTPCPPHGIDFEEVEKPTTTTPIPAIDMDNCKDCAGCIALRKQTDFKWKVQKCTDKLHFICEGRD